VTFVKNDTPPRIYGDVRTVSRRWIPSSLLSIFDTAVCSATSRAISFHREIMGDFAPYLTNEVYGFDSFTYYCAGTSRIRRISRGLIDSVVQRFAKKKAHPSIDISVFRSTRISCFRIFCTRNADNFDVKKRFELQIL